MGGVCSTHAEENVWGFVRDTWRKDNAWITRSSADNIKMDFRETECEGVN
jgi:hypothetical protein